MTTFEKIGLGVFLMLCGFFLITGQLQVQAAVQSHFGNLTAASGIINVKGFGVTGSTAAALETFSLSQGISPSTLSLNLSKNDTPTGTYTVTICVYPDELLLNPCQNNPLRSWTNNLSDLTTSASWVTFDTSDLQLYPTIGYGIYITLGTLQTGSNYLNVHTNTGAYADGMVFTQRNAPAPCTGADIWNRGFLCGDNSALASHDMLFDIFGGSAGSLTVDVHQNGPEVGYSGFCATPSSLPAGWTLGSNSVGIHVEDVTSGTGTNVLYQATCDPTQGTYASPLGTTLWNGDFKVTATQFGTPHTFSATKTFTVTGSSTANPSGFLTTCQDFELTDTLSFSALKSSVGCSISAFAYNVTDVAPFSWHRQVTNALTASGTTTVQIGIPIPSALADGWTESSGTHDFDMLSPPPPTETIVNVFDSSTDTGIANKVAERFPFLRTFATMFLWLELGLWLAGLIWIVLPLI